MYHGDVTGHEEEMWASESLRAAPLASPRGAGAVGRLLRVEEGPIEVELEDLHEQHWGCVSKFEV